ncbi:disease resistance protein RPP2A-like isoform X2 [Rosa chinensis]|uniref:disease resistance protein RPP2A-like isoform X2 n=1 Tax=Rosa chinensis TaxID=74649 RepID=UPI001AD8D18E|nr:disease resistance protein RPP2A-like isoform X2 [Rosa chinensis]
MLKMHGFSARRGIDVLINKSLISISGDNHLEMHDLLQEMGQSIVHEQCTHNLGKRSRLWNAKDVYQVLKNRMGTTKLQAIHSDISTIPELQLNPDTFKNMHNLRLLKFSAQPNVDNKMHLPEGLESFPEELRYLYWERYPSESLPSEFSPHNLVELHMPNGKVKKLSHNGQFPNIEAIDLCWCTSLVQVPKSFMKNLDKLTRLELAGCSSLKASPELPRNLRQLDLSSCSQLTEVPDLSRCPNVEEIDLCRCTSLVQLPKSIFKNLDKLFRLQLAKCSSLKVCPELPRNI